VKILPDLWIAHPAADSMPVSLKRWLWWKWSEIIWNIAASLHEHGRRCEHRALYPHLHYDDDIPF
jgi:hypothetical protein